MKTRWSFLLVILVNVSLVFGQVAVIEDSDGFVKLRIKPEINSKVIYQINNFELFLYSNQNYGIDDQWVKVSVPKSKYSLDYSTEYVSGYIHKSRCKPLDNLPNNTSENFHFEYNLEPFNSKDKIFEFVDEKWVNKINNKHFYGTDGALPNNEVASIDVSIDDKKILVPQELFEDIFEVSNEFEVFVKSNQYYIRQWNSDGAGGYLLVWSINSTGIDERFIFIP